MANVTVVLMDGSGGNNCGVFEISGGGNINMSAQTSGTYSGILFFRHASCGSTAGDMKLVGGATATVVGVVEDFHFTSLREAAKNFARR